MNSLHYFGIHNHTMYSNLRLLDSINRPDKLIDKAIELGLSGICITDHESLSAHVEVNKYADQIRSKYPNFTIGLGNEIYLTDTRETGQKYFHFILLAKDAIGHKALRELSSTAWYYSYSDRGMERVPTLKSELAEVVKKYPGHLIATSACLGGELSSNALMLYNCLDCGDQKAANEYSQNIDAFLNYCLNLFGDDFYIECAPSTNEDQIITNYQLSLIAKQYNVKMVVGTDAHYLTKEDRWVHKSYLNSKGGEREVDAFYEFARLMNYEECSTLLHNGFAQFDAIQSPKDITQWILQNTLEIQSKITSYTLFHTQDIPRVEVKNYPLAQSIPEDITDYPTLSFLYTSNDIYHRYWINQCLNRMSELKLRNKLYLDELEEEARVKRIIGEKLHTNMFRYPITLQHYIDMIWDCGSMVGAGRGSSCAALNHYLLGVTQLDPIQWDLPFFRYLNEERVELGSLILILPSCK